MWPTLTNGESVGGAKSYDSKKAWYSSLILVQLYTKINYPLKIKVKSTGPEMEFLDINLTKDSSLLLHAIQSPFYCRILKKTVLFSRIKNTYKKIPVTRKLESS